MKKSVYIYESVVRCVSIDNKGNATVKEISVPYKNQKEAFKAIEKMPISEGTVKVVPVAVTEHVISTYKVESELLQKFLKENGDLVDSGRSIISDESEPNISYV